MFELRQLAHRETDANDDGLVLLEDSVVALSDLLETRCSLYASTLGRLEGMSVQCRGA